MGKFIVFVLFFSFLSVYPLLKNGLPPTHDGEYHIIRFYEFDKVLRDGTIYPRWAPDLNNGFGVPLFNYVYPLPNFSASLIHSFGASFIDSFKLSMFFATILGAVFMFFWARIFFGNLGGLVSSAFYSFSPYHSLDVYIRGSVGEVWALVLFPAFLYFATQYIREKKIKFAILTSVFLSLVIMSHNILGLMFFSFGVLYILFLALRLKGILLLKLSLLLILGTGLASIFWLPAIFEREYVRGLEVFSFSYHFPEVYELLIPSWGSGFSGGDLQDQLSFQVGIANLLAVFVSLIVYFKTRKENKNIARIILFFLFSFLLVFLLMLKVSLPIWETVPLMSYFQFPWRFLSLIIIFTSFLAGASVLFWKKRVVALSMIFISIILGVGYSKPAHYLLRDDNYYISRSNFIDGTNSPGNSFNTKWIEEDLKKEKDELMLLSGKGMVNEKELKSTDYKFYLEMEEEGEVLANIAYFPGWTVYVNGKKTQTKIYEDGRFTFSVPKGKYNARVYFENTDVQKAATFLSLASFLLLILLSKSPMFATIKSIAPKQI